MRKTESEIKKRIQKGVLLLDGALGSELKHIGGLNPERLSITNPDVVKNLHDKYLEYGADIIRTNTFNQCTQKEIESAVRIACESVEKHGDTAIVAGVVPPIGDMATYAEHIRLLIEGGVDILLFETIMNCENMRIAYNVACEQEIEFGLKLPKIFSATVIGETGKLISGESLEEFANEVSLLNPLAAGVNCGDSPEQLLKHLKAMSKHIECGLVFYPSAGLPDYNGNYSVGVGKFSAVMREALKIEGLTIIGGCCGTTPKYIEALRNIIDDYRTVM
ncbi:MAG: homocysteine S-methyltransferase family protein [Muribaculaceae bacterium]|nr:homocysteine S-methyltransferase family protein [Muribaculaceae bacterium]